MRLSTILDPRFPMALSERINRLGEWSVMKFVWHLPRYVIYWAVVRGTVDTAGEHRNPSDVRSVEILDHLNPRDK